MENVLQRTSLLKAYLAVSSQRTDTLEESNQSQQRDWPTRKERKSFWKEKWRSSLEWGFLNPVASAGLMGQLPWLVFLPGGGATPPSLKENKTNKMLPG